MAHDVRTPLTALTLSLSVLERAGIANERGRWALGRAQAALSQTVKITEGLLEFARSGAHPGPASPVTIRDVAAQVCTVVQSRAEQIGAGLAFGSRSPSAVTCSDGELSSVISNLVGTRSPMSKRHRSAT
jgi:signal transduction histidine kinase